MHVLYIVPYPPSFVRVRSLQLIRSLARRGHRVTVATLWSNDSERADVDRLADEGFELVARRQLPVRSLWNCLRAFPGRTPMQAVYSWQPALASAALEYLRKNNVEVVQVEHLRGARYGVWLRTQLSAGPRPVFVWDSVDSLTRLFEQTVRHADKPWVRAVARHELRRLGGHEAWLACQFDGVTLTSCQDQATLEGLLPITSGPGSEVRVLRIVPNGVDLAYFRPEEGTPRGTTLVMSGKMSYHANARAARYLLEDIMPRVWRERPDVGVTIVGRNPGRRLKRIAAQCQGRVRLTGTVPDIRPHLHEAVLAAAPLVYGTGTQNKVLEAMACGLPVVATVPAIESLQARPGVDLLASDGAPAFARQVLDLLASPSRRAEIGRSARAFVERHHDWDGSAARLETLYESLEPSDGR